jgi:hypothetical protein
MNIWPKSAWTDAGQVYEFIAGAITHKDQADALHQPPPLHFKALVDSDRLSEAVFFVGHALPRYESVVWAAQSLLASGTVDRNNPLVVAVLRWIDDPCEDLRRNVQQLALAESVVTSAYMLANAVFMSGGSISIPDGPPVLAPPDSCAKFAVGAVLDAASSSDNPARILRLAAELGDTMASQGPQH